MSTAENPKTSGPEASIIQTAHRLSGVLFRNPEKLQEWTSGLEIDPASDNIETIIALQENPVGTTDEVAIVTYHGVEAPHQHDGPEFEAHVIAEGSAIYVTGDERTVLQAGDSIVIPPNTPHFAYPAGDDPFTAAVISSPGFDPERMVSIETAPMSAAATATMAHHHNVGSGRAA